MKPEIKPFSEYRFISDCMLLRQKSMHAVVRTTSKYMYNDGKRDRDKTRDKTVFRIPIYNRGWVMTVVKDMTSFRIPPLLHCLIPYITHVYGVPKISPSKTRQVEYSGPSMDHLIVLVGLGRRGCGLWLAQIINVFFRLQHVQRRKNEWYRERPDKTEI